MSNPRRIASLVLLILLTSLITWPQTMALTPQDQTISITDTHDDLFITETGIGIDSQLCHILDPTMDIRSFLVFRGLEINWWEPLKNATLRFRTTAILDFDADSSVTVYGMRYSDLQDEGILRPGWVLSVPLTSASVTVNTSQFYGQTWHEVNVTAIVKELKQSIRWDGHGTGGDTGDDIGFIILGVEGYDTRWFIDYLYGTPSLAPQLVIHWNHEVSPPAGYPTATFNQTYGEYDIWNFSGAEFGWINYTEYTLYNVSGGEDFEIVSDDVITGYRVNAGPTDDFRLQRATPGQTGTVFLSVNITEVFDNQNGAVQWVGHLFGHANANKNVYNLDNDLNRAVLLTVSTPENDTDNLWRYAVETHNAGVWNLIYGQHYNASKGARHYLNVTWNYPSKDFIVKVHSLASFSDASLIENINRTGYVNILGTYSSEFAFNTNSRPGDSDWWSFNTLSTTGTIWLVTDENGTVVVDDCETLECAQDWIDTEDPDPEDPDPGGEWSEGPGGETGPFTRFRMRLYYLGIGFGCVFGPVLFFAWRRPSGYYLGAGFILMLMGLGMLLAIGQV